MSPVSLLFSSDEDSSRQLVQALRELELEIEPCPDIFTAVEWLTSRSFDVIAADWDSGPEAAFLLKSARELKLNKAAFTLALTSGTSESVVDEDAPDLVLTKPLIPDQVKYSVLSNDRYLTCMRAWIARGDFTQGQGTKPAAVKIQSEKRRPQLEQLSPVPTVASPVELSPAPSFSYSATAARLNLTFATLDRTLFRSMNHQKCSEQISGAVKRYNQKRFLWTAILSVAFISVGYIWGQPLQVQSVFASVATAYKHALVTRSGKSPPPENDSSSKSSPLVDAASRRSGSARYASASARVFVPATFPTGPASMIPTETLQADARPDQGPLPLAPSRISIPESLTTPPQAGSVRTESLKRSPSLLSQVEPVNLNEDLSQALLLQRVRPTYPEQALRAGLQGAVTLQAWIGKDGSIRDLKLVDGSLLLGQAAVKAVKQWRYKPYLRNGVAVEAETFVTVNFKLP
jgi:TonB family protein